MSPKFKSTNRSRGASLSDFALAVGVVALFVLVSAKFLGNTTSQSFASASACLNLGGETVGTSAYPDLSACCDGGNTIGTCSPLINQLRECDSLPPDQQHQCRDDAVRGFCCTHQGNPMCVFRNGIPQHQFCDDGTILTEQPES